MLLLYYRKYGSRPCSLCNQVIGTNEQIMRVNSNIIYHLSCFICVKCHIPLVKGDRYVLFNGQPFCEKDNPIKSSPMTKRGTTSKRGAKSTARNTSLNTQQIQSTFLTPSSQYHPSTGHISLLNNSNTITHSLLSNNSSLISTSNTDEIY